MKIVIVNAQEDEIDDGERNIVEKTLLRNSEAINLDSEI